MPESIVPPSHGKLIKFREASDYIVGKICKSFKSVGKFRGGTEKDCKSTLERVSFFYLLKLVLQQKICLYEGKIKEDAVCINKNYSIEDDYSIFFNKKGTPDKIKLDTLVGDVPFSTSHGKISIDDNNILKFGKVHHIPPSHWLFRLHEEKSAVTIADDLSSESENEVERGQIKIEPLNHSNKDIRSYSVDFIFKIKINTKSYFSQAGLNSFLPEPPSNKYRILQLPDKYQREYLPIDYDFLEYSKKFIFQNYPISYLTHVQGLFFLFLFIHSFTLHQLIKDNCDDEINKLYIFKAFRPIIENQIHYVLSFIEEYGYIDINEIEQLKTNSYPDVEKIFNENLIRVDYKGCSDVTNFQRLNIINEIQDAKIKWLTFQNEYSGDEDNKKLIRAAIKFLTFRLDGEKKKISL
jgi:hypothetical protein